MVELSKFFQNHVESKTCQSLLLHTGSCRMHCLRNLPLYMASNFKYFAPLCIIPALIKLRSMNKEKLRHTLEYYVRCSLVGSAIGYSISVLICLLRNLSGRFGFYTFVFVPAAIGGCMSNLGSTRVIDLFQTSIFQCNVETFFLMRRYFISRLVANSPLIQTYIFMLCSAIIVQGKYLYNIKGFWLLKPNSKISEFENQELSGCELHPKVSCQHFLLDGMRKYFVLGLTLDIVKALMSKVRVDTSQNHSILLGKVKNFRIRSSALLTAYIGIYRFAHCLLNRNFPSSQSLNHIASAFLAGICYNLYPQSTLFSYALVQAIRTLWNIIRIENVNTKSTPVRLLLQLPFGKILFPFALGNIVHLICLKPEYCSRLTDTITNGVTNNYANCIKNEINILKQKVNEDTIRST